MKKEFNRSIAVVMIATFILAQCGVVFAQTSDVPECQFTTAPTPDMLQKCQDAAAKAAAGTGNTAQPLTTAPTPPAPITTDSSNLPPSNISTNIATSVDEMEANLNKQGWTLTRKDGAVTCAFRSDNPAPDVKGQCLSVLAQINVNNPGTDGGPGEGFDSSKIDFSKFGPVPQGVEGGVPPMFAGKELSGDGADAGIGKLGNALEEVKQGLDQAEEGMSMMKDGQIKIDPTLEKTITSARGIYNDALKAFQAGDYAGAGAKLQELSAVGFDKKYAAFADKNGVSLDLIKDIRNKIKDAMATTEKSVPPEELIGVKGDLISQNKLLDQAESLLKSGKKQDAAAILKKMKKEYGDGEAQAGLAGGKGLSSSQISSILDKISSGIDRAGSGLEKAKANGTDIPQNVLDLNDKMKALYTEAKAAFDSGDNKTAMQKLQEIRALNPEQTFTAFRDSAFPKDRLKEILQQGKDGAQALHISIERVKEWGVTLSKSVDVTDLEDLSVKLDDLVAKAEVALNSGDTDTFLTYMDQARGLNTREKVDAAIRAVTLKSRGEILGQGLTAVRAAASSMEGVISELAKQKGDVSGAQTLLSTVRQKLELAQSQYDSGDYMTGGYTLDDGVLALSKLINLLKDSGVKISNDQNNAVIKILQLANTSTSLVNTSSDNAAKAQGLINGIGQENNFELKFTMGSLSPDLMDKVLNYRSSDKKLIDSIINEVVPLVPEEDRTAILEGKIGLLDESKNADKTISVMKGIKGISKDTLATVASLAQQAKGYTFTSDVAENLKEQFASFNDKIQSGELKDQQGVDGYVQALKDLVAKGIASSNDQKYKDKLIPAKNIDDNNPLFQEMQYLRKDGAVSPDKNGNINLNQKIDKNALAGMINKTVDKNAVSGGKGTVTVQDAIKTIMGAYKVKPGVDLNNAGQTTKYLGQIGADVNAANFKKPATMKDVADILAAADERWGSSQ